MRMITCFFLLAIITAEALNGQIRIDNRPYQSPVKYQANRGTCTAFAVIAALETFPGFPSDLSEQYLYANIKSNPEVYQKSVDYEEGAFLYYYIQSLQLTGTVREDQEPYNPNAVIWEKNASNFDKMKKDLGGTRLLDLLRSNAFCYTIKPEMYTYYSGDAAKNIEMVKSRMDQGARCIPVSYFMDSDFWSYHPATRSQKIDPGDFLLIYDGSNSYTLDDAKKQFSGDIFEHMDDGSLEAWFTDTTYIIREGHAVAIVGYDESGFLIKNSWGTSWGEEGYGWVSFDYHRMYAAEVMTLSLGNVKVNTWVESDEPEEGLDPGNFRLKSLPHEYSNPALNMHSKDISISVVYHGTTQMPRFTGIEYNAYDNAGNLVGSWYGNTHGIFDGRETGYETYILGTSGNSWPSAHKLVATFTTLGGARFTNTYINIEAKNREYEAE